MFDWLLVYLLFSIVMAMQSGGKQYNSTKDWSSGYQGGSTPLVTARAVVGIIIMDATVPSAHVRGFFGRKCRSIRNSIRPNFPLLTGQTGLCVFFSWWIYRRCPFQMDEASMDWMVSSCSVLSQKYEMKADWNTFNKVLNSAMKSANKYERLSVWCTTWERHAAGRKSGYCWKTSQKYQNAIH